MWSTVQLLMSNFFITFHDLRFQWLAFLKWFSALYYSFEGLARVEFGGAAFDCSRGIDASGVTFLKQLLPHSRFLDMSSVTAALMHPGDDCVADTDALLRFYRFERSFKDTAITLSAYYACTHVCTFLIMLMVGRRERR
ncbi:hypothetical protein MNEG_13389 [Monoraphidium neglectum]|uniref:Uncharacterized protein n=1 Tax=Monoraphidium neglectum TaxID=145388 RepID=A0A0D2J3S5_9CHLO|nr:hypothetical protein MNEG_13389 [Monoraphidium neglectum]KIY94572.1 hypothetical protein MNEG_13389 [Monoraphidium neglectum]|eukprot:XP_013893592.1 hypothetical protein MNEG_13389 [Monoraphidium neglectum]